LDVAGIKIADLNVSTTGAGGKEASGNVSFFGFDHINLKAEMSADRKVKSISSTFPATATLTIDKLSKFFSGRSLSSFLPKSFPLNTGISIKDLSLQFDDRIQGCGSRISSQHELAITVLIGSDVVAIKHVQSFCTVHPEITLFVFCDIIEQAEVFFIVQLEMFQFVLRGNELKRRFLSESIRGCYQ
jgi:hypothetical protein